MPATPTPTVFLSPSPPPPPAQKRKQQLHIFFRRLQKTYRPFRRSPPFGLRRPPVTVSAGRSWGAPQGAPTPTPRARLGHGVQQGRLPRLDALAQSLTRSSDEIRGSRGTFFGGGLVPPGCGGFKGKPKKKRDAMFYLKPSKKDAFLEGDPPTRWLRVSCSVDFPPANKERSKKNQNPGLENGHRMSVVLPPVVSFFAILWYSFHSRQATKATSKPFSIHSCLL